MAHPGGDQGVIVGYEAKVELNGVRFAVKSGSLRFQSDLHESGDTEKGAFKRHKAGRKMAEFSCEFNEPKAAGSSNHIFAPQLNEGDNVFVILFRDGNINDQTPDLLFMVVESYSVQISLDGIVNGSISARSDGWYLKKGESTFVLDGIGTVNRTSPRAAVLNYF